VSPDMCPKTYTGATGLTAKPFHPQDGLPCQIRLLEGNGMSVCSITAMCSSQLEALPHVWHCYNVL